MCLLLLSFRFQPTCTPAVLCFSTRPACYVCVYVNMHECIHAGMQKNIWCAGYWPICRCEFVCACLQTRTVNCSNDTSVSCRFSPPSRHQWLFIFFFFSFLLPFFLTDWTGNACLIGQITEASASCWRNVWRCKKVRRYSLLLLVSSLIFKGFAKKITMPMLTSWCLAGFIFTMLTTLVPHVSMLTFTNGHWTQSIAEADWNFIFHFITVHSFGEMIIVLSSMKSLGITKVIKIPPEGDMEVPDFMAIHLIFVEIFHSKPHTVQRGKLGASPNWIGFIVWGHKYLYKMLCKFI